MSEGLNRLIDDFSNEGISEGTSKGINSFDSRKLLLEYEAQLMKLLGRGDLTPSQRGVLGTWLNMVRDLIKDEVWLR